MAAFDSEEIETLLDENKTGSWSNFWFSVWLHFQPKLLKAPLNSNQPISEKRVSGSALKVVVKKWWVSQQFRPEYILVPCGLKV